MNILTDPVLPMIPVTTSDLSRKYPTLAPEQNKDPEKGYQVWKAEEALPRQVPPELEGGTGSQAGEAALTP